MKKLLILSGKGGTGKTTTASAFIQFAMARAFADCDVDAPNLHLITHVGAEPEKTAFRGGNKAHIDPAKCINCGECARKCRFNAIKAAGAVRYVDEFACEGCGVCEYICPRKAISLQPDIAGELTLYRAGRAFSTAQLRMGRGNSGKLVSAVKSALDAAAPDAAFEIIDGSPGVGCPVIASISGVDMVLIIAEPSLAGLSDMERILRAAQIFGVPTAVCVNKYDVSPQQTAHIEAYCQSRGVPLAGRIPYDTHVPDAINAGRCIADTDCPARDALKRVFKNVVAMMGGAKALEIAAAD